MGHHEILLFAVYGDRQRLLAAALCLWMVVLVTIAMTAALPGIRADVDAPEAVE